MPEDSEREVRGQVAIGLDGAIHSRADDQGRAEPERPQPAHERAARAEEAPRPAWARVMERA